MPNPVIINLRVEKTADGKFVCVGNDPQFGFEVRSGERAGLFCAIGDWAHECGIRNELVKDR